MWFCPMCGTPWATEADMDECDAECAADIQQAALDRQQ